MPALHGIYGRETEWDRIVALLQETAAGTGGCLVIDGARKLGKTTLLLEAVRFARAEGFVVHSGLTGVDDEHDLEALLRKLDECESSAPVLIAVDDVSSEWLTSSTLRALAELTRRWSAAIILTVNSAALGPTAQHLFVPPRNTVRHLRLEYLSHDAIVALATEILGEPPASRLDELLNGANGCPYVTVELLEGLREEGFLARPWAGEEPPLPGRVRAIVQARLSELSLKAVHLVWVAAALGRSTDLRKITNLMREPTAALLSYLDESIRAGLLVFEGQRLSFQCTLFRVAVLGTIPEPILVGLSGDVDDVGSQVPAQRTDGAAGTAHATEDPALALTEQEREIARLVGTGLTNQQVATRMFVSPHTVNYHLRSIYKKLSIRSRVELVRHIS